MNPTREDVIAVIKEFKTKGPKEFLSVHHYAQSTKFDLLYQGHRYPPKAIYNVARKRDLGENDKTGDVRVLSGGPAVNNPLKRLKFEIVPNRRLI